MMFRQFPPSTAHVPMPEKVEAVKAALANVHDTDMIAGILAEALQSRFGLGRAFVILDAATTKAGRG